jgi:4'-phosphopantetheinyl transferase
VTRVDVWTVDTTVAPLSAYRLLTREERARAARIRLPHRAREVAATRAALRAILGAYTGAPPTELALDAEQPHGKPRLRDAPLRFNVSHARGLSLIVVADGCEVGVDVEAQAPRRRAGRIARRHFTAAERAALDALPAPDRPPAFLALWTAKEAALKAFGLGLALALGAVDAPLGEGPVEIAGHPGPWQLRRPALPPGYAGAVVAGAELPVLRARRFAWSAALSAGPTRRSPPPSLLARRS